MKSDLYTKFVLTAIALSLSVIAIQLTTKDAHAQSQGLMYSPSGALMVTICDPSGNRSRWTCADVDGNAGVTVKVQR
jgi:hypothetical protein